MKLLKLAVFMAAVSLVSVVSTPSFSIVIRHDVKDENYRATIEDFPPLATLYAVGAHGTLIAPQWVATAAHTIFCIEPGDTIKVGHQWAQVEARYAHHEYERGGDNDIALIKLAHPVLSVEPASLYRNQDESGRAVWFIGAGGTGNGNLGQSVSYKENKGVLRKAQNIIEATDGNEIEFTFDKAPNALPLEGVSGNGDSGGPAFEMINGRYYLLGISSRADSWFKKMGEYGVNEVYTRVSYHADWIDNVMLESPAFIKTYTTQKRFAQSNIVAQLDAVCQKVGFDHEQH